MYVGRQAGGKETPALSPRTPRLPILPLPSLPLPLPMLPMYRIALYLYCTITLYNNYVQYVGNYIHVLTGGADVGGATTVVAAVTDATDATHTCYSYLLLILLILLILHTHTSYTLCM